MKKILLIFLSFLATVLLVQTTAAYTYINIYIDSAGNAEFLGETNETPATLALPAGISVQDGRIRGTTQELTAKAGETWIFSYSLKDAEIKAILPERAAITNLSNPQSEIFLERGRISVYFTDSLAVSYIISNASESNSFLIWTMLILLVCGIAGYFYRQRLMNLFKPKIVYKRPKQKKKDHIEMIRHVLNPREQLILGKLKETGKVKMSHLRKLCDIPKASFSRHVQELERKKLVAKSGEGKNKFVSLSAKSH